MHAVMSLSFFCLTSTMKLMYVEQLAWGINYESAGLALRRHVFDRFMSSPCFTVYRCINTRVCCQDQGLGAVL